MNDCMNAEIRDQLPELVHDRLDAARRSEILAHVASCSDCRDEVELLRAARAMFLAQTPRVDVSHIVSALPLAKPRAVRVERRRVRWNDWRIAAAITLIVGGGSSLAVLNRERGSSVGMRSTLEQPPVAVTALQADSTAASAKPQSLATPSQPAPTPDTRVASDESAGLGSSRLGELSEQQLKTLLDEIDQLQATPITEPEPVSLRVRDGSSSAPEGA